MGHPVVSVGTRLRPTSNLNRFHHYNCGKGTLSSGAESTVHLEPFLLLRPPISQRAVFCTYFLHPGLIPRLGPYTPWANVTTSQGTGYKNDEKDQNQLRDRAICLFYQAQEMSTKYRH